MVFTTNFFVFLVFIKMNQSYNDPFQFRVNQAISDFEARDAQPNSSEMEAFNAQVVYLRDILREKLVSIQSITSQLKNGRGKAFDAQVARLMFGLGHLFEGEAFRVVENLFAEHELPEFLKDDNCW
jgi:hypothetical protein